jgi:two-component system NtrC family sensor kinase
MNKRYILWLLLLFFLHFVFAQNNLPSVNEITTDTTLYATLFSKEGNNWQKLEDHTGKLTIAQVSQPPLANNFHFNTTSKPDFSVYAYWYRYRLKNSIDHDISIIIPTTAAYCDIYIVDEQQKWKHYETGWLVPWSRRDGLKYFTQVAMVLKKGQELRVYQRERITSYLVLHSYDVAPTNIGFTDKAINKQYVDNDFLLLSPSFLNVIIGISLLAALFNLFFYTVVREKLYLYFALFLLGLAVNRFFVGTGALAATTAPTMFREFPLISSILFYTSAALTVFYLTHFVRYYLELHKHYPAWDKLLRVTSFFCPLLLIGPFLIPVLSDGWNKIWMLFQIAVQDVLDFLVFVTFLLYVPIKSFARLRLIYVFPFVFQWGLITLLLDICTVLLPQFHYVFVPGWLLWIGTWFYIFELPFVTLMVLFFTWTLFNRFRLMQEKIAQQALEREIERSQLIQQQKTELEKTVGERTAELKQSLENLKATQKQLVQSEKMASLGELTAGIAHEIQNPLNFVNNFSEVNTELIEELKSEKSKVKSERNEGLENEILDDIYENLEKIALHGKRADAIVKGMLQHSRASTGKKELTDINALADEYLRLSYHGLRAKDKDFNADFTTEFDESIGKIEVVPQDIGRVLLNLYNNAFYAVNEKKKQLNGAFEPTVTVVIKKIGDKVEIVVKDNGNGIPQKVVDKIFQPFFTTKPTGQGTGLGLSLSYDIIKAHDGELKVETKEGEGAEFIIQLPIV